jgi:hypothetical protein
LSIYHIGNNLAVLALPAFVFLLQEDRERSPHWVLIVVALMQAALMVDVPVHAVTVLATDGIASVLARDCDRIVVLLAFGAVTVRSLEPRSARRVQHRVVEIAEGIH